MKIENGTVVLETTSCHCSSTPTPGQIVPLRSCCQKKRCGVCKGEGYVRLAAETCSTCKGTTRRTETLSDYASQEMIDSVPLRILRADRQASWNESYLGFGCVYSCIDYGDAARQSDEALLARLKERNTHFQACHFVRLENRLPVELVEAFGVYVNRNGFSVRPIFASTGLKKFNRPGTDIAVGLAVANAGGYGTLAAAILE